MSINSSIVTHFVTLIGNVNDNTVSPPIRTKNAAYNYLLHPMQSVFEKFDI